MASRGCAGDSAADQPQHWLNKLCRPAAWLACPKERIAASPIKVNQTKSNQNKKHCSVHRSHPILLPSEKESLRVPQVGYPGPDERSSASPIRRPIKPIQA